MPGGSVKRFDQSQGLYNVLYKNVPFSILEEVRKAIKQKKNNKASGNDFISSEAYKHGGEIIAHHLHNI